MGAQGLASQWASLPRLLARSVLQRPAGQQSTRPVGADIESVLFGGISPVCRQLGCCPVREDPLLWVYQLREQGPELGGITTRAVLFLCEKTSSAQGRGSCCSQSRRDWEWSGGGWGRAGTGKSTRRGPGVGMSLACLRDRRNQGGPSVLNGDSGVTVVSGFRGQEAQNLAEQARSFGSVTVSMDAAGVSDGLAGPDSRLRKLVLAPLWPGCGWGFRTSLPSLIFLTGWDVSSGGFQQACPLVLRC